MIKNRSLLFTENRAIFSDELLNWRPFFREGSRLISAQDGLLIEDFWSLAHVLTIVFCNGLLLVMAAMFLLFDEGHHFFFLSHVIVTALWSCRE